MNTSAPTLDGARLTTHRAHPDTSDPPGGVIGCAVIQGLGACLALANGELFQLGVGVLLTIGLLRGSVLAQRLVLLGSAWACLIFADVMQHIVLDEAFSFAALFDRAGVFVLLIAYGCAAIFQLYALTRSSAKTHFGLICPSCGGAKVRGASLLYGRLKCRACGHLWSKSSAQSASVSPEIDPTVFD